MKTRGLDKRYERLTGQERYRLLVLATARGDRAERERLIDSCEWVPARIADPGLTHADEAAFALVQGFTTAAAHWLGALSVLTAARRSIGLAEEAVWEEGPMTVTDGDPGLIPTLALACMELASRKAASVLSVLLQSFARVCEEGPELPAEALLAVHAPWFADRIAPFRTAIDAAEVDPGLLQACYQDMAAVWRSTDP